MKKNIRTRALLLVITLTACSPQIAPPPQSKRPDAVAHASNPSTELKAIQQALNQTNLQANLPRLYALVQKFPEHAKARLVLAQTYLRAGRAKSALREARVLLKSNKHVSDATWLKARAQHRMGLHEEALIAINTVLAAQPRHEDAHVLKVKIYTRLGLGAYQRAAIEALIKQFPDKWVYRIEYAKSKLKENDPTGAEKLLNEAIQGDPYQVEPHVLLALLSYEGGRFMKAMDHADIALRIDPTYPKALSLFRASFYVAVASKLWCKHGHGPWKKDAVEAVLDSFRKQGLKGVAFFYEVDKEFGRKDDVQKRIQTAAKRCMAKR